MRVRTERGGRALFPMVKRAAFAFLRARQSLHLYRAESSDSSPELRVLHVGRPSRGRDLLQRLCGTRPVGRRLGGRWVGPRAPELSPLAERVDLIVVDINRLYAPRYRRAGYFTIPEWVEFGREVVADPRERYSGARKSLKCDLKALRESGFEASVSRRPEDFRLFCAEMYRPHVAARFGEGAIAKSTTRLGRDFQSGFLLLLRRGGELVAGAIVRIDGERLSETTFAVREGSAELLRSRASAALDYHLHEWAAENRMRFLNVGHTRPFPGDGVFFNKRKWLMSLFPDGDGVLDHALRWVGAEDHGQRVLARCPFVCGVDAGLGLLAVLPETRPMNMERAAKTIRGYWTEGLRVLMLVCPGGYLPGTVERIRQIHGPRVELYTRLNEAAAAYRRGIAA